MLCSLKSKKLQNRPLFRAENILQQRDCMDNRGPHCRICEEVYVCALAKCTSDLLVYECCVSLNQRSVNEIPHSRSDRSMYTFFTSLHTRLNIINDINCKAYWSLYTFNISRSTRSSAYLRGATAERRFHVHGTSTRRRYA